jgi:hypothetical protein
MVSWRMGAGIDDEVMTGDEDDHAKLRLMLNNLWNCECDNRNRFFQ